MIKLTNLSSPEIARHNFLAKARRRKGYYLKNEDGLRVSEKFGCAVFFLFKKGYIIFKHI